MSSKTKIHQDANGNASSGRVIGLAVVGTALIFLLSMILFCFIHPDMALAVIGVTGGTFTVITSPTFIFLYNQKKTETSTSNNDNETNHQ